MSTHEIFSRKFAVYNRNVGLFLFLFAIISISSTLFADFIFALYGLFAGLIFFIVSLLYFSKFFTWNLGAKGEEIVIEELEKLSTSYRILNDVRLSDFGGNIDHIVMGENGVFLIETKHHKGDIKYRNGVWTQEKISRKGNVYFGNLSDPIKQANRNAVKLREVISKQRIFSEKFTPWIHTIVVFTNPNVNLNIENTSTDVIIVEDLCRTIQNKKTRINLRKNEIEQLSIALKTQSVTSDEKSSVLKNISESNWLKSYVTYMKFGVLWGIFYTICVTLINLYFQQFVMIEFIDYTLFSIFFNGLILFVLGKSVIDLFKVNINNDLLRLSSVHFISYLPIFLFTQFYFTEFSFINDPLANISELITRFGLIVLTIVIYKKFSWKMPI